MTRYDEQTTELNQFLHENHRDKFEVKDMFEEPGKGEDVIVIILKNDSNTSFKIWGGGDSFGFEASPNGVKSNIMVDWATCFYKFKEWAKNV